MERVAFPVMVSNLFKTEGLGSQERSSALMHATVGVIGEVVEFLEGTHLTGKSSKVEEMGDILFYIEAGIQALGPHYDADGYRDGYYIGAAVEDSLFHIELMMLGLASAVIDGSKRVWVYGKSLEEMGPGLSTSYGHLQGLCRAWMDRMDIDHEQVLILNQEKLAARYPAGVYSNYDALARADKEIPHGKG